MISCGPGGRAPDMRTLQLWLSERLKTTPGSEVLNVVRGPACLRIPVAAELLLELKALQVIPVEIIEIQKVCLCQDKRAIC